VKGLDDIGVKVVTDPDHEGGPGNAPAILREIEQYLERLVATGEAGAIDLRSLPLAPGDHQRLLDALGEGEVSAEVQALGPTRVRETAVRGVWWITHYNDYEQVIAEFIEVTTLPEILETPAEDLRDGLERLRAQLTRTLNQ